MKISFCVFVILSAYSDGTRNVPYLGAMENAWKVAKRIRRIPGKVSKPICNTQNHLRIRGKYLNIFGEYAEKIYVYMEKGAKRLLAYSPKT